MTRSSICLLAVFLAACATAPDPTATRRPPAPLLQPNETWEQAPNVPIIDRRCHPSWKGCAYLTAGFFGQPLRNHDHSGPTTGGNVLNNTTLNNATLNSPTFAGTVSINFSSVATGTSTGKTLTVGAGSSLVTTGSGIIQATKVLDSTTAGLPATCTIGDLVNVTDGIKGIHKCGSANNWTPLTEVNPTDFGATCNASGNDDATGIESAYAALPNFTASTAISGGVIRIPPGCQFDVGTTVDIASEGKPVYLIGSNPWSSRIVGKVALAGLPVVKFTSNRDSGLFNLSIDAANGTLASALLQVESGSPVAQPSTHLTGDNLIFGFNTNAALRGVYFTTTGTGFNNELADFTNTIIGISTGIITQVGWEQTATNELHHQLRGVRITAPQCFKSSGGSLYVDGGIGNCSTRKLYLTGNSADHQHYRFNGFVAEDTGALFKDDMTGTGFTSVRFEHFQQQGGTASATFIDSTSTNISVSILASIMTIGQTGNIIKITGSNASFNCEASSLGADTANIVYIRNELGCGWNGPTVTETVAATYKTILAGDGIISGNHATHHIVGAPFVISPFYPASPNNNLYSQRLTIVKDGLTSSSTCGAAVDNCPIVAVTGNGFAFKNTSGTDVLTIGVGGSSTAGRIVTAENLSCATDGGCDLGVGAARYNNAILKNKVQFGGFLFANLATALPNNGEVGYCSDCTIANPCAGSGTGAFAKRLNGVYVCN